MFIRINPRQRSVHDLVTRGTTPNTKMDDFLNNEIFKNLSILMWGMMKTLDQQEGKDRQ